MPAHKVGRLWKFRKDEVDGWVRQGETSVGDDEVHEHQKKTNSNYCMP